MKHHFLCIILVECFVDAALVQEVSDKFVCSGSTLILNWRYDASDAFSVTWSLNSTVFMYKFGTDDPELVGPQFYRIKHIDNGEIHVMNVSKDDAGVYKIILTYKSKPTDEDSAIITVIESPSHISFYRGQAENDGRRSVGCYVIDPGLPPVIVKIKVDSILYSQASRRVELMETVDCCLDGESAKCLPDYTNGLYCENIFTPYGPRNISISPGTREYTFNINEALPVINCFADCDPPCEFSWTKDGSPLTTVNGILPSRMINGRADKGIYKCTAIWRSLQEKAISITVNVRYGPIDINFIPSAVEYMKAEGEFLTNIICVSDCYPGCAYRWSNGSTDVSHTNTLSLGILHRSEAANYLCTARNNATGVTMEKNLTLHIMSSPRPVGGTSPVITAQQDTKVVLSLTVLAYPPPTEYVWYKWIINDWMELYNYASIISSRTSLQFNLTISNFKQEDYGEYKLTVDNGVGNHMGYVFTIKRPADEPQTGNVTDETEIVNATTGNDGLLILSLCLGILLAIALFTIVVLSFRTRLFRKGLFGGGRHKGEKDLSGRRTGDIPMSSLEGTDATATSGDNIAADHVYDEMKTRASQEHSYGQLEHNTGSAAKTYENFI